MCVHACVCVCVCVCKRNWDKTEKSNKWMHERERERGGAPSGIFCICGGFEKSRFVCVVFFSFVDFRLLFDFVILLAVHSLSLPLPSCLLSLWIRGPNCFIAPLSAATHAGVFVLVLKDSTSVHKIV